MQNAVYEASTLLKAADERVRAYQQLEQQIIHLKEAFNGVANLGDEFKGRGADNIKSFYEGHAAVANQWLNLIRTQIAFFESIPMQVESANLKGQTVVNVSLLETELAVKIEQSNEMVAEQKAALTNIFNNIQDIMSLSAFSSEAYNQSLQQADTKRKNTIEAVETLDQNLVSEYGKLDTYYETVSANQKALMDATRSGGHAAPMYFSEKAYHASGAFQIQSRTNKLADTYVEQKNQERKAYEDRISVSESFDFSEVCENPAAQSNRVSEALDQVKEFSEDSIDYLASMGKKSANSFKEIGSDVWEGMRTRSDKWNDSWYDFGNYMTMGAFDGTVSFKDGLVERSDQKFDSTYDFLNYASAGLLDIGNEAINPDDPLSKEHWLSSVGLFSAFLGGIKPIRAAKPSAKVNPVHQTGKQQISRPSPSPSRPAISLVEKWKEILSTPLLNQNNVAVAGVPNEMISKVEKAERPVPVESRVIISKGIDKTRPSWRQSEIDVGKEYPGYRDQVSYKEGNEVSHGTKNSSRPDFYIDGHSIEVKNYKVTTSSGRSNLIRNVSKQINKRISDLPEHTKQSVIIDVRGQNVSRDVLRDIKQKINERTNDVAEIIFKMD
ncbi:hypothetical protein FZC66_17390 [Priestia megaterium]|nr:hypothetical protein FZC66_17390 [Priestia megaterium]